jgi:hypothetical protein
VAVAGPRIWNFASGFGCGCSLSVGASSCRGCVGVDVDTLASAELGQAGAAWASDSAACSALPSAPASFSESCPLWGSSSGALGRAGYALQPKTATRSELNLLKLEMGDGKPKVDNRCG